MDGNQFDQITRAMGGSANRRGVLKTLAAVAAGLAGFNLSGADAACKPGGWYCQRSSDCCSGACYSTSRNGRNRVCCSPASNLCNGAEWGVFDDGCGGKVECSCADGLTPLDDGSCAECGNCDPFQTCTSSGCANPCDPNPCSGTCRQCIAANSGASECIPDWTYYNAFCTNDAQCQAINSASLCRYYTLVQAAVCVRPGDLCQE